MSKVNALLSKMVVSVRSGHRGIFTSSDLAMLIGESNGSNFKKYLSKLVKSKVLKRIAKDVYFSEIAGVKPDYVLEHIANVLHWRHFIYVSLESELSRTGEISQVVMKRLTVMTTGRSGTFDTPFGVVEFVHTKRDVRLLENEIFYDSDAEIFRATRERAMSDLKRAGRNVQMLEGD